MTSKEDKTYKNLRVFNAFMGAFHLIQAVIMLVLSNDFSLPITTSFLRLNLLSKVVEPNIEQVTTLRIGPLVAGFLLVSAAAHFLLALPVIYQWYVKNLKKKINMMRWYEYAFSSSLMIIVIAMLSGMYDLPSLVLIFSLNACMIFFGLMMELHNQTTKKTDWTAFVLGCFAGLVPWVVIIIYFFSAAMSANGTIPDFVYGIMISLFLFFNIFAVNMYLQYKEVGPWNNYLFGERVYIVLSLLAKSALAWQVFSGTLRGQ